MCLWIELNQTFKYPVIFYKHNSFGIFTIFIVYLKSTRSNKIINKQFQFYEPWYILNFIGLYSIYTYIDKTSKEIKLFNSALNRLSFFQFLRRQSSKGSFSKISKRRENSVFHFILILWHLSVKLFILESINIVD